MNSNATIATELFASGAAVGAVFAVLVDIVTHHAKVGLLTGDYAVAIPVAVYVRGLWYVRDRFVCDAPARYARPAFAVLIVLVPLTPLALERVAARSVLCAIVRNYVTRGPRCQCGSVWHISLPKI